MLRYEQPNTRIEDGFEKNKDFFNRVIAETVAEIDERGQSIGDGKTADVKVLEQDNSICLKIVDNLKTSRNKVNLKNRVNEEIEFLDKLSDKKFLASIGITQKIVPRPMFSKEVPGRGFLFMEKIDGLTLEDIFKNRHLVSQLPANFNAATFFTKLEDIVTKLNKAKIFHRDLHEGNIFIDSTGEPIIIDFGDAYETVLTDEDPYTEEGPRGEIIKSKSDLQNIKEVKEKFMSIIN